MKMTDKKVLVADSDISGSRKIIEILSGMQGVEVVHAKNVALAYQYSVKYNIALFILNPILNNKINGDLSGIEFAQNIRMMERYYLTPIIFVSNLSDKKSFAYENIHCYQYFQRPYEEKELKKAVDKILKFYDTTIEKESHCFKINGELYPLKLKNIVWIENKTTTIVIHCSDRSTLEVPYRSTRQLLMELNVKSLKKCNKNTVVNIEFIEKIVGYTIYLKEDYGSITIGRRLAKSFKENIIDY